MSQRERLFEDDRPSGDSQPAGGTPDAERLADMRQAGDAFLNAGDEAISRALSGDSAAFLEASRQTGGQ